MNQVPWTATAAMVCTTVAERGLGRYRWLCRGQVQTDALEGNVSLYHTEGGRRITIKYIDAPVAANVWHILRVESSAKHIRVIFDGKPRIELDDGHISGAGEVGVWTKTDSVTAFDDFTFGGH